MTQDHGLGKVRMGTGSAIYLSEIRYLNFLKSRMQNRLSFCAKNQINQHIHLSTTLARQIDCWTKIGHSKNYAMYSYSIVLV